MRQWRVIKPNTEKLTFSNITQPFIDWLEFRPPIPWFHLPLAHCWLRTDFKKGSFLLEISESLQAQTHGEWRLTESTAEPFVPWDPCLPSSTLLPASGVVGRGCIKGLSLGLQLPVGFDQRDRRNESIILPVSSLRVFIRLAVSCLLFGIPLGTTSQSSGFNNFSIPCFAEWKQPPGQYCTIPCWFLILWSYPFKQSFYQNFLQLFPYYQFLAEIPTDRCVLLLPTRTFGEEKEGELA